MTIFDLVSHNLTNSLVYWCMDIRDAASWVQFVKPIQQIKFLGINMVASLSVIPDTSSINRVCSLIGSYIVTIVIFWN